MENDVGKGLRFAYGELKAVPLVFCGIGVQRAWGVIARPSVDPMIAPLSYLLVALISLVLALISKRLPSLGRDGRAGLITGIAGAIGTLMIVIDSLTLHAGWCADLGYMLGCASIAVTMLMWCDFFSHLSPTRVAFIYALALILDAVLGYLFTSIPLEVLWPAFLVMLPLNSTWAVDANVRVAQSRPPSPGYSENVPFPVVAIAAMSIVWFDSGLLFAGPSFLEGASVSPAALMTTFWSKALIPILIVLAILDQSGRRAFDAIYVSFAPIIIIAMIATLPLSLGCTGLPPFLFQTGQTALALVVMIVFSNMTFRYGIDPIRLNGIERFFRYGAFFLGWICNLLAGTFLTAEQFVVLKVIATVVTVVIFFLAIVPNSSLFSAWGITRLKIVDRKAGPIPDGSGDQLALKSLACEALAKEKGLTARELEVMLLYTKGMTFAEIANELTIAPGTLKAHTSHIYGKLDVHSVAQMDALVKRTYLDLMGR